MKLIYDMIQKEAAASWKGSKITRFNYHLWEEHWLGTARAIQQRFANEGLHSTAETVKAIIGQQEGFIASSKRQVRNNRLVLSVRHTQ